MERSHSKSGNKHRQTVGAPAADPGVGDRAQLSWAGPKPCGQVWIGGEKMMNKFQSIPQQYGDQTISQENWELLEIGGNSSMKKSFRRSD